MNSELKNYITSTFPQLFDTDPQFKINDGRFPLILFTCRYFITYCDEQNIYADKYPDKYQPCEIPNILSIYDDEEGFLIIRSDTNNPKLLNFLEFIRYISGSTCEISGLLTNNVYVRKNGQNSVINRKFISNTDLYNEIDSDILTSLVQKYFHSPTQTQLEFNF